MRCLSILLSQQRYDIIGAVADIKNMDRSDLLYEIVSNYRLKTIHNTPEIAHLVPDLRRISSDTSVDKRSAYSL